MMTDLELLASLEPLVRRAAQAGGAARELRVLHGWSEDEVRQEARVHALRLLTAGTWSPDEPVQHVMQRIKVRLIDRCREERRHRGGYLDHRSREARTTLRGYEATAAVERQNEANVARAIQRETFEAASTSDAVDNILEGIKVIADGVRYARQVIEAQQA